MQRSVTGQNAETVLVTVECSVPNETFIPTSTRLREHRGMGTGNKMRARRWGGMT